MRKDLIVLLLVGLIVYFISSSFHQNVARGQEAKAQVTKWEYKCLDYKKGASTTNNKTRKDLEISGQQGWELIVVTYHIGQVRYIYKRAIK